MKSISSPTQQQPFLSAKEPNKDQVLIGLFSAIVLVFLITKIMGGSVSVKNKTARAAWATTRQKNRAQKIGKKFAKKMRPKGVTGFVQQPTGGAVNLKLSLKRDDTLFFPFFNQSALVVGGAGVGKTANFILPVALSLLAQGSSMIYYEFKSLESSKRIIATAVRLGYDIRIFAPGHKISGSFNAVDLVKDETSLTAAKEVISIMALNLFESEEKARDYFDKAGFEIAAAVLCLAKWVAKVEGDPSLANLMMASQILSLPHLAQRLTANRAEINPWTYDAFTKITSIQGESGTNKQQMGVIGTAQEVFGALQSLDLVPVVAQPSNLPRFCKEDPLKVDGKHLIVCVVDKTRRSVTTPILATFVHNICIHNLSGSTPRLTPLAVIIDEADTLKVPVFLNLINQERSNGFCGVFGFQHLGQPQKAYGENASRGFLASCATKIWFACGDLETAKMISERVGEKEIIIKSVSRSVGNGKPTQSTSLDRYKVPLISPDEALHLPVGKAVIESPGVGDRHSSSVPYLHQFKYSEELEKQAEAEDEALFDQVYAMLEEKYQPQPPGYYEQLLRKYLEVLDRLLPLPSSSGGEITAPENKLLTILGSDLIKGLEIARKSTEGVVPGKSYPVPTHLIGEDSNVVLNADNCMEILGKKIHV
jgi:type IV secretion system protein VirD4